MPQGWEAVVDKWRTRLWVTLRLSLGLNLQEQSSTPGLRPDNLPRDEIVLQHQLNSVQFHTLYGHLSLADIDHLHEGKYFSQGELLAHFGEPTENGQWPPHLHFQIIEDMGLYEGNYPGVCKLSERNQYLQNCPNPDLILKMMQYI